MTTYPGNPSLAPDVQQKIRGTFQQTLDLASRGSLKEAQLGCDFVLRLDPAFDLATRLQERLELASGAVDVSDLQAALDGEPGALSGSGPGGLDLPELPPLDEAAGNDPHEELQQLLAARQFDAAVALAERLGTSGSDPEVAKLVEQARHRLESEPFLQTFLAAAKSALGHGDLVEAERMLRKARLLDATYPGLPELEAERERRASVQARLSQQVDALDDLPPLEAVPDLDSTGSGIDSELEPDVFGDSVAPARSDGRIDDLLREGQEAFDRGELQNAIDAWSRIFLIDIDHREAGRRIEQARRLKAERERQVEEVFHEAVGKFDAGEVEAAKSGFEQVLQMQPSYLAAQEYLERIASGALPRPVPRLTPIEPLPVAAAAGPTPRPTPGPRPSRQTAEIFMPPDGASAAAKSEKRADAPAPRPAVGGSKTRLFALIAGAVFLVAAGAGWYLFSSRERLFPNSRPAPTVTPAVADPVAKARSLQTAGKTAAAIAQLRKVPANSPSYAEAQALLSQWQAMKTPTAEAARGPAPALDPEQVIKREQFLARAQAALQRGETVRAVLAFDQAASIAALDGEEITLAASARDRVALLEPEIEMFRSGDLEYLLNALWKRRNQERGNRDLDLLMVDAYHNLGVRDLQRGDTSAAAEKFREALALDPRDPALKRLDLFARTYQQRSEDLLYRTFVKGLATR